MSIAVLMSIKPRYCELIASGRKTAELRKTCPRLKLKTPFKCYIYETLDKHYENRGFYYPRAPLYKNFVHYPGKVIGEFVCERIEDYSKWEHDIPSLYRHINLFACIDFPELYDYLPNGGGYGWHISNLVIYDKPKELSEFSRWEKCGEDIRPCQNGKKCQHVIYDYIEDCEACDIDFDGTNCPYYKVQRPPQSWMYVEEIL